MKACSWNEIIEIQLQMFIVLKKFYWPISETYSIDLLCETERKQKKLNCQGAPNWF